MNWKHGQNQTGKRTREYECWVEMRRRCLFTRHPRYKDYGGRGITICKRWLNSFLNFFLDMGKKPKFRTLDRINNDKGYKPSNCRWATRSQQSLNRRQYRWPYAKGFSYHPGGKRLKRFQAIIGFKGKRKSLGYFMTAKEAHAAFEKAKQCER